MTPLKKIISKVDYKIIILSKMIRYALKYVLIVFYWKFHARRTSVVSWEMKFWSSL